MPGRRCHIICVHRLWLTRLWNNSRLRAGNPLEFRCGRVGRRACRVYWSRLFRPNNQAGGSNATGNWGYMMCVDEITQQSKDMARLPGVFVV